MMPGLTLRLFHSCRYYARGLFAAEPMMALPGTPGAAAAAPLPVLDWPLRHMSSGALASGLHRLFQLA